MPKSTHTRTIQYAALVVALGIVCSASSLAADGVALRAQHRLPYNNPELVVDVGVGLWAIPFPMDWDKDGDNDLVVSTADWPYRGVYLFENDGSGVFQAAKRLGDGKKNVMVSYVGDNVVVCEPGKAYRDFRNSVYAKPTDIPYKQEFYSGRTNQWRYADYDGDGVLDLLFGASDWKEYGWDNAFDSSGKWLRGPLHGYVYWARNLASNDAPKYAKAENIQAAGEKIDVYGCPSPNLVDWDNDGDMDLICGEFLDRISFFENIGTRTAPQYAEGRFLEVNGKRLHMELEMLQVVVFDWDQDGDADIVVGQEDGRVAWIENAGPGADGTPRIKAPVFFQQRAENVQWEALTTPCSIDWDGDGDEDIICGNTAGFVGFIENLGGGGDPKWAAPQRLEAGGEVIRIMAGPNLSIQGPAEAKWGYTVPYAADWDMDGLPDIVMNTIVGKIVWYRNVGTRTAPRLAPGRPVEVEWPGTPPKPAWFWWNPAPKELVVQWRSRPIVSDIDKDGLNDLMLIDHEGYLSLFRREKRDGKLILLPGERVFKNAKGEALRLSDREAGGSGRRKIDLVDWDGDGDGDILINSPRSSPNETRNIAYYENIGKGGAYVFQYRGDITKVQLEGHTTSPTTTDWDGDGVRDLLVGAEDGFFYIFKRKTPRECLGKK